MILVDSSVWIAFFNRNQTHAVAKLRAISDQSEILVADIVLLEVLQGARDEKHAEFLKSRLQTFHVVATQDEQIAIAAAHNYRILRGLAFTVRKTPDLIIATYCIACGHQLLQDDRDFVPFEQHLGLRCL